MTVTINGAGGITGFGGVGPAFSAYQATVQSIPNSSLTKINFDTVEYDTASCFSGSRFTPNVAGYYLCSGNFAIGSVGSGSVAYCSITKNGAEAKRGTQINATTLATVSAVVYLNGSTDYVELAGFQNTGAAQNTLFFQGLYTYFQATLVRAATVLPNYSVPVSPSNGPTFRAGISTAQALVAGWNLLSFDTKQWDTASCFNNTSAAVGGIPAYAFRPTVAGYYQVNVNSNTSNASAGNTIIASIFKNGSELCRGSRYQVSTAGNWGLTVSDTVYLNGSTDYIDARFYAGAACNIETATGITSAFSANLARLP